MDLFTAALSLSMAAVVPAETAPIRITSAGTAASAAGPADYFTGRVRIDAPFQTDAPARVGGATVTFEPGARTAWHTHPLGQTLVVTAGCGWTQCEGEPIVEIRAGDVPGGFIHRAGGGHAAAVGRSRSRLGAG